MQYILAIIVSLLAVCAGGAAPPEPNSSAPQIQPFAGHESGLLLTLAGSNTLGGRLAPAWARAYLAAKGASAVALQPLNGANEYRVRGLNNGREVFIDILAHGSSTGFLSLETGRADIAMASRPIKPAERDRLRHLGDLTEPAAEHVVAIDGLAIIVHPDNPLRELSVTALTEIFSGRIQNWRQLGGPDLPIHLYARDHNSGTWETFAQLVLHSGLPLAKNARRFESSDLLSDRVASDPAAIGFVGLASIRSARALAVSDGESASLLPGKLFVATEDYPLARRLYLYRSPNSPNFISGDFIAFVQQGLGQDLVEQVGFVAQEPVDLPVQAVTGPPHYRALAAQGKRLSVNFRFRNGSAELDNKAKRDVLRLAQFLRQPQNQRAHIQLVGFSGQYRNQELAGVLSRLRATAVKSALFAEGVRTRAVVGLGAELPIADQQTGKSKNDRVEVWLISEVRATAMAH